MIEYKDEWKRNPVVIVGMHPQFKYKYERNSCIDHNATLEKFDFSKITREEIKSLKIQILSGMAELLTAIDEKVLLDQADDKTL